MSVQGCELLGAPVGITGSRMTWIGRIWKGMLRHIAGICKAVGIWKQTVGSPASLINHCEYGRWSLGYFPRELGTGVWREVLLMSSWKEVSHYLDI